MSSVVPPPTALEASESPQPQPKASYIGAPAVFKLEQACQELNDAFGRFGCYGVGSAWERADWRDVDVRFILEDAEFAKLFPDVEHIDGSAGAVWEFDPRWLLLTTCIADRLSRLTGLPVDFQFQPQTFANTRHKKRRNALGLRMARPERDT